LHSLAPSHWNVSDTLDRVAIPRTTLTAGRLAEECLWEARGENLSENEVIDAAGGNLFTFVVSELNRAADQKIDEEGE
jgi:hypothetical protein